MLGEARADDVGSGDRRDGLVAGTIARAGVGALGITAEVAQEPAPSRTAKRNATPKPNGPNKRPAGGEAAESVQAEPTPAPATARTGTKQALVIGLLSRGAGRPWTTSSP